MAVQHLVLGSVVIYKGSYWVALGYNGSHVTIIAPDQGNIKLQVHKCNLKPTQYRCVEKSIQGKRCLVTPKGLVISLISHKVLKARMPVGGVLTLAP